MAEGDFGIVIRRCSARRTAGSGHSCRYVIVSHESHRIRKYKEMLSPLGHLKQVVLSNALRPSGMSVG